MNLSSIVNKAISIDLDGMNMKELTLNKYEVVVYEDIVKYKSLKDLLGPNKGVILLYETTSKYAGHWTCVWISEQNKIMFFDSYGFAPDEEIKYSQYLINSVQKRLLTSLFIKDGRNIEFNKYRLQKWKNKVNTCGRWVALRIRWRHLSHQEFFRLFNNLPESPDFWATILTFLSINNDKEMFEKLK